MYNHVHVASKNIDLVENQESWVYLILTYIQHSHRVFGVLRICHVLVLY